MSKTVRKFNNEDEEREFWDSVNPLDYFETSKKASLDLSKLRQTTKSITIRMLVSLIEDLKRIATKKYIPYQSLMKMYLTEQVKKEQ